MDAEAIDDAFRKPWLSPPPFGNPVSTVGTIVFHIALMVRWWERGRSLLPLSERANLERTGNVLKASRRAGVSTSVYTSSASVGISLASRWFLWPWEKYTLRFIQVVNENDRRLPKDEH